MILKGKMHLKESLTGVIKTFNGGGYMSGKILETNNYGKFEMLEFNRDVRNTIVLEESMKKHGWLDAYPMHVIRNNDGQLKIKAGHNRFVVAKKLGIPVKYVECKDEITIYELEKATVRWSLQNYLESHIRTGKTQYIKVREFKDKTGIQLSQCISLLSGEAAGSFNAAPAFKNGTYQLGDQTHANIVADIILHCRACEIFWATNSSFVGAISKLVWAKGFDPIILKNKISTHRQLMVKQPSKQQYLTLLDSIFNYQSRVKIPLAFHADEAAKVRSPFGKDKNKVRAGKV